MIRKREQLIDEAREEIEVDNAQENDDLVTPSLKSTFRRLMMKKMKKCRNLRSLSMK